MSESNGVTPTPENGASQDPASAGSETPDVPAWAQSILSEVKSYKGYVDESLKKQYDLTTERLEGFKKKHLAEPAKKGDEPAGSSRSLSFDDLNAAMRLGSLQDKLGDRARKRIDSLISNGQYVDAVEFAESIIELSQSGAPTTEAPKQPAVAAPPGVAATSAPRSSQDPAPRTQGEFIEIAQTKNAKDKDGRPSPEAIRALRRYEALMADPDFDPALLPIR